MKLKITVQGESGSGKGVMVKMIEKMIRDKKPLPGTETIEIGEIDWTGDYIHRKVIRGKDDNPKPRSKSPFEI